MLMGAYYSLSLIDSLPGGGAGRKLFGNPL